MSTATRRDRIAGSLIGTAVGDALGLPREGLSAARARRMFGDELRHAFLFGRGMVSDDTEHTCFVAQALLASGGDRPAFVRSLAWKLRLWALGLPAGVGMGTARALAKLWLGVGPERSGAASAGNGPAMRAAILGVACTSTESLRELVHASSRITHSDERATRAAHLVAIAARHAAARAPTDVEPLAFLQEALDVAAGDAELFGILTTMQSLLGRSADIAELAAALGQSRGVSGYAYHSVPIAVYGWLTHPADFRAAVTDVVRLGGDADTTGAIVGGIVGAGVGATGIPQEWIAGLWEWPRTASWMHSLAGRLASMSAEDAGVGAGAPGDVSVGGGARDSGSLGPGQQPLFWPALLPRNALFLAVVLAHGLRRLLPPYGGGGRATRPSGSRAAASAASAARTTGH